MAQRTITILTDDLDGSEATETVTFGLDGQTWEIDLNEKNAGKLRKALEPYTAVARKVGRKSGRAGSRTQSGPSAAEIRDWARSNGFDVPDRGRIPADVRQAFDARK